MVMHTCSPSTKEPETGESLGTLASQAKWDTQSKTKVDSFKEQHLRLHADTFRGENAWVQKVPLKYLNKSGKWARLLVKVKTG